MNSAQPSTVFRVKFADGPLAGHTREYNHECDHVMVFGFTYEATGRRDGDYWLFARVSRKRWERALIRMLASRPDEGGRTHDPRLDPKRPPDKVVKRGRNEKCWCGSGKKYKKCHGGAV